MPIISCVIFVISETPGSHYCQTSSQDLTLSRQQVLQRGEDHLLFNVLDIDNKSYQQVKTQLVLFYKKQTV